MNFSNSRDDRHGIPVNSNTGSAAETGDRSPGWLTLVRDRVRGLRFGVVQIVVHDGRVTQVESTERVRLAAQAGATQE